jgi:endogenous inhibitor of DNA gyrase (YacG/DUF329 family)
LFVNKKVGRCGKVVYWTAVPHPHEAQRPTCSQRCADRYAANGLSA